MNREDILRLVNKGLVTATGLLESDKVAQMPEQEFLDNYVTHTGIQGVPTAPDTPEVLASEPQALKIDTPAVVVEEKAAPVANEPEPTDIIADILADEPAPVAEEPVAAEPKHKSRKNKS